MIESVDGQMEKLEKADRGGCEETAMGARRTPCTLPIPSTPLEPSHTVPGVLGGRSRRVHTSRHKHACKDIESGQDSEWRCGGLCATWPHAVRKRQPAGYQRLPP